MSRDAGIRIDGARELRRTLKAAGDDLGDLKSAHAEAAKIAASASADLAPRQSGRLQASIRGAGTQAAGIVRAGKKSVPYANAVHWGRIYWPNRSHPRRAYSPTNAQPFISDGATTSEGQWIPVFERAIDSALAKVKGT